MRYKVRLSFVGIALLTLMMIYDKYGNAVYGICAAVFHEAGHLSVLLLFKDIPEKITVGIFGIRIERTEKPNISYRREAVIALAGPVFNIATAFAMSFFERDMSIPIKMNLAIAFFNLLPLTPLDGGKALYSLLCTVKSEFDAKKITKIITVLGIIPLTVMGLYTFLNDRHDYSLLLSSLYVSFALLSFPYN